MAQEVMPPPRVVVGVDGSAVSIRALRWAFDQASATGSVVEAVHAWEPPSEFGTPLAVLPRTDRGTTAGQVLATAIERASAGAPKVPVERRVVRGQPASVLVERSIEGDLLVVGSHGHRSIVGAMIGSVSQHCVQHAACPVVVVRG